MADKLELMRALKESMKEVCREEIKNIPYQFSKIGSVVSIEGDVVKVNIGETNHSCSFVSGLNLVVNDVVLVMFLNGNNLVKIVYGKF
jgi:hypothetical protein